jgi:hypothetical protein
MPSSSTTNWRCNPCPRSLGNVHSNPYGVYHQSVAFVMSNRIPAPRRKHLGGVGLVHAHMTDLMIKAVNSRNLLRSLQHLHCTAPE